MDTEKHRELPGYWSFFRKRAWISMLLCIYWSLVSIVSSEWIFGLFLGFSVSLLVCESWFAHCEMTLAEKDIWERIRKEHDGTL